MGSYSFKIIIEYEGDSYWDWVRSEYLGVE